MAHAAFVLARAQCMSHSSFHTGASIDFVIDDDSTGDNAIAPAAAAVNHHELQEAASIDVWMRRLCVPGVFRLFL